MRTGPFSSPTVSASRGATGRPAATTSVRQRVFGVDGAGRSEPVSDPVTQDHRTTRL